jgi:UDP:flavonoid glycosyltransferase YjiC (YdhE family)
MLAIPTHNEQRINSHIAARHGFCRVLELREATSGVLADAIRDLVENPDYRASARQMAAHVRASRGAWTAAIRLEQIAREGIPAGSQLR